MYENDFNMQEYFKNMNNPYYLPTKSMTNLYDEIYPPKTPIIENLLYSGTYLFVGAPKVGKSFFMAQIAYHISKGIDVWNYKVNKGTVLYLALEDDYARLQRRLYTMFGESENDNLYLATTSHQLNDGLDKQLEYFIETHKDTKLIIIDTLQKIRELSGDKYSYGNDYDIVTKLKKFSDNKNVCLLLVHHTRKQQADDCFETISGTNGLLGAADGAFILQKEKRTSSKAVLDAVGRDQQDQRLYLEFNREHCLWEFTKAENEIWKLPSDPILESVSKIVTPETTQWSGTATELVIKLNLDILANSLTRHLNVNADRLLNEYQIEYANTRTHSGRQVSFKLNLNMQEQGCRCDDSDDITGDDTGV